jgi:hypothetical protein
MSEFCFRSTKEKISYHLIHANASLLFENISSLKDFITTFIHYLLFSIIKHRCKAFHIEIFKCQFTILDLIELLAPHVMVLRNQCSSCCSSIPNVSISDIAHILVINKSNQWSTAIDINVYSKNQQFRLFNSVKYGKNNPLVPCEAFPFDSQSKYSSSELLYLSMISTNYDYHIPIISFKNDQFNFETVNNNSEKNFLIINKLNDYLRVSLTGHLSENNNTTINATKSNLLTIEEISSVDVFDPNIEKFTTFVQDIIKLDPSHQGYILSCRRGDYNKNILFFNIGGNYRYCPKINAHHRHNTVAIMINIKNNSYSIRCKDKECDNTTINWKKIP